MVVLPFQFAALLVVIFILEIAAGIAGFVMKGQVDDWIEDYMTKSMKDGNKVWDDVQKDVSSVKFLRNFLTSKMYACCNHPKI